MADATVAELTERFGSGDKPLEADVVAELQSIMRIHQLDPQDLFFKWESYCIKMDLEGANTLSYNTARAFKKDLQDALERNHRALPQLKAEKRAGATPRAAAKGNSDVFGMLEGLTTPGTGMGRVQKTSATKRAMETPSVSRIKAGHVSSSPDYKSPSRVEDQLNALGAIPPSSFNDRQNPGELVEVLNDHLPAAEPPIAPFGESRVKTTAGSDQKKLGYKPMAMKLSEASEILDDRIDDFLRLVMEHHKLDDSAFGSAASQSTSEIVAVGRMASDSPEGKLNTASLVLETSRRTGGGLRIPLNVSSPSIRGFHFFPGQIVALRGHNASGREFTVKEILSIPLLPYAASPPSALESYREKLRGGPDAMDSDSEPLPLSVMFASGPYTADDNLDFEPLHALCERAGDTYADALILTGPFIDAEHPLIASGDFDLPDEAMVEPDTATLSTVFKYMISPALNRLVQTNPHVTVLLMPSVRDAIDKHVSWPQDAFPRKDLGLAKPVRTIGNPMTLRINEAVMGISSQDILWELRTEGLVSGQQTDKDLLSRLSRHLLEQRHYFPLFPPTDRSKLPKTGTEAGVLPGSMLDVSYLKLGEMVGVRPDILMIPSALPPFAKEVENVLVINPGYLSKRRGAGTYARMLLYPPKLTAEDMNQPALEHKVLDRARVEITRI